MDQNNDRVIDKFWQLTDREKKEPLALQKVRELHNWGVINDSVEKSPTLKALVQDPSISHGKKLPEGRNYTSVFEKIMEELNLTYTKKEMDLNENFKKMNPKSKCVVIKVATTPVWAFDGSGQGMAEAIEAASRKGVRFLITVSTDNVIF